MGWAWEGSYWSRVDSYSNMFGILVKMRNLHKRMHMGKTTYEIGVMLPQIKELPETR